MQNHQNSPTHRVRSILVTIFLAASIITTAASKTEAFLQATRITGKVVSATDKEPIPGVNILIKGTNLGSMTDAEGRYSLEVTTQEAVLVFSAIGFDAQEIVVGGRTTIDITLTVNTTQLSEVVVVGYGTQEKISVTSSVSELDGKELLRRPVSSLGQALQGQLPGVTVLDRGGSPGSPNTQIVIRGVNKPFSPPGLAAGGLAQIGDNSPLVMVDNVEQPFQNINPEDIESITILKDASSTAIYGSRAANGVVLITTKRAKSGKVSVNYSGFYANQRAISNPEHMEIESYLRLQNVARENVGSAPIYTEDYIQEYTAGTKSNPLKYPLPYDWYNVVYDNAPQINHNLSVSGGTETMSARMSLRSQRQEGIIANTQSDLTDVRLNTDFKISKKIGIAADINYRNEDILQPTGITDIFRFMMQNSIWAVPQYPNGVYGGGTQGWNPLLLSEKGGTNNINTDYLLGSITGRWEIIKDLNFSTQLAIRSTNVYQKNFVNTWETRDSTVVKRTNLINRLTEGRVKNNEVTINSILTYSKSFGNHGLKFLAGYSQIQNSNYNLNASRQGFYNNDVRSISQGTNDGTKDNTGEDAEWALLSYFGRANYAYKDKYFAEANFRYDGSSRFTGDNQYSFFPSFSAGWRLSQESFWGGLTKYISDLKIRGSWGETGNQAVQLYSYYPTLSLTTYNFNNTIVQGYQQTQLADPGLTWETTTQTNFGLDAELLEGRITLSIDRYFKTTEGILLNLPVPGTLGLQAGPQNAGVVENNGWEFLVGTTNRMGKFTLSTNINFSINENEVIDLAGAGPFIVGTDIDPRYITGEGYPINAFWGYRTGGLFQTQDEASNYPQFMRPARPGDVKVLDLNNDGQITPEDMTYLGNSFPKYIFGGSFNLSYKQFTLNMLWQGAADVGMRVARALGEQGNFEGFTHAIFTDNYWTPERPDARFPRPTKQDLRNQASTDRMIIDASYLRLKNIQLVYRLPASISQKAFMQQASIYVSGTNLLTFSKLNEWNLDPESTSGWQNYYPQTAMFTLGVNLQF